MLKPGVIFGFVIASMVIYLLINTVEYYEEEMDLGWRREARANPFLAAQLYVEKTGRLAFSADSFNAIDTLDDFETIFISNSSHVLSETRLAQLVTWVENGGHLIIGAQPLYSSTNNFAMGTDSTDRVLDYFEVWSYLRYDDEESETSTESSTENKSSDCTGEGDCDGEIGIAENLRELPRELADQVNQKGSGKTLTHAEQIHEFEKSVDEELLINLRFTDSGKSLRVFFHTDVRLWHPAMEPDDEDSEESESDTSSNYVPFYWQNDEHGTHFMQLSVEAGLVSVLSTPSIFTSTNIDKFGHADLWDTLTGEAEHIAILYGTNMPSLWTLVKSNAPEVLISSALLLSTWIVFHWFRFGPVVVTDVSIRRSLAEHISASGRFLWRSNHGQMLLDLALGDLNRVAELRIDGYAGANEQQKATLLAKKTGVDRLTISGYFEPAPRLSKEIFLQKVSGLQTLRHRL